MKRKILLFFIPAVAFLSITFSCKKESTGSGTPAISTVPLSFKELKAERTGIRVGETTLINASVEGSNLTYNWSCSAGTIVGQGAEVTYGSTCISCKGLNTITCSVSDGTNSQTKSIEVSIN